MNVRQEILKEHSKAQCSKIVLWVGKDQKRFDDLFHLFLHDEFRVVQRAAWPVCNCVMQYPALINSHWKSLINLLKKENLHDAVKRNGLRLMQDIKIPEKYHGEIMSLCFTFLESPKEALAIKVFAMTVLGNLAGIYPDIIPELTFIINEQLPNQSAGFKSRAKKVFKIIRVIK
jgi:hypothetical protein